jgi:plasmid stability protein
MPNMLIRDVPESVHARLLARADRNGQSLQQFVAGELRKLAERPSMDEVLDRIAGRRGGRIGLAQAADDLDVERDRR